MSKSKGKGKATSSSKRARASAADVAKTDITLFCAMDGDDIAFSVKVPSNATVDRLSKAIKAKIKNTLRGIDADQLALWQVSFPDDGNAVELRFLPDKEKTLLRATYDISDYFQEAPLQETISIVVQKRTAPKRGRDEDEGPSPKRSRFNWSTVRMAIEEVGLAKIAVVDGKCNLSLLSSEQRVTLLGALGEDIGMTDPFNSLAQTALELRHADVKVMDKLSAPLDATLPVVETTDLYVRQTFKELYDTILEKFENTVPNSPVVWMRKHVVVLGTSGIGKSAFLVYFIIRILAESNDNTPPLIIFHTKRGKKCYAFGGLSTVRSGCIEDFKSFLNLTDTWYLVDSSPNPALPQAKTIIATSPEILTADTGEYQEIDKKVAWQYDMTPWNQVELETCRKIVAGFQGVPMDLVQEDATH